MDYFVIEIVKNTQGQYGAITGTVKSTQESAMVMYHQKMAAYMNASDVAMAQVIVENSAGGIIVNDVFVRTTEE